MIMDLGTAIAKVNMTASAYQGAVQKTSTDQATVDDIQRNLDNATSVVTSDKNVVKDQASQYTSALTDLRDSAQAVIDQLAAGGTAPAQ